jgi:hypothetical protein
MTLSFCRTFGLFALVACVLAGATPALAQVAPQAADQATINSAVARGVQFLRNSQNPSGGWGKGSKAGSDGGWAVGYAALAGITLIECGVPPADPSIQAAARGVRSYVYELDTTYEVALAILFLDRLGEKNDRKLIQLLAGRLIAGQSSTGGWGYKLPNKSKQDVDLLVAALRKLSPAQPYTGPGLRERPRSLGVCIKECDDLPPRPPAPPFDFNKARQAALRDLPVALKRLSVFVDVAQLILEDPKDKGWDASFPTTDNSNTHFATLALWAARKYDVPTDRSFAMLANRYRTSQNADGTWSYAYVKNGENGGPGAMTCVALLGLAIGHVLNADPAVRPEKDPRVINAFTALSKLVDEPAGRIDNRPPPESKGGLYFFWGMERIAVLYDLRQLDKKDWYLWGAEILLCHQSPDGSWQKGGYHGEHPVLNTCFALLFLRRANLTPDLSRKLTVDTSALASRVNTVTPPPQAAPEPTPPPEPTVAAEPPPPPKPRPVKPKVEAAAFVPEATEPEPPPAPKSNLPWILGLIVLGLSGVGCIVFALIKRSSPEDEEGEDEPRAKKRSGAKAKARVSPKAASKSKRVGDD